MGRRGPAPVPTRLKVLHGETRPSRLPANEPIPREAAPEPPGWLSPDALRVWDRTVAELTAMGMAHAADTDSLVVYCTAVVNHARAQQLLDVAGPLIKGVEGNVVRNPAVATVNAAAVIINRYAREFGLTPSARVNLGRAPADLPRSRDLAERLLS
jgi:P27 family predicted phage terminase small subunit